MRCAGLGNAFVMMMVCAEASKYLHGVSGSALERLHRNRKPA
jgi:hypothetical protein